VRLGGAAVTLKKYSVVPGFPAARELIKSMSSQSRKLVLLQLFSRPQLSRILSAQAEDRFLPQLQRRVIAVAKYCIDPAASLNDVPDADRIYRLLSARIRQSEESIAWLHKLEGEYRYFRYHAVHGTYPTKPVEGALKVESSGNGSFLFEHRSHDWSTDNPRPEHTGWVLRKHGNVYFIGSSQDIFRLGVLQCDLDEDPKEKIMDGLVLSARTGRAYTPFAARAVIINVENPELLRWRLPPHDKQYPHMLDQHCQADMNRFMSL
jgi:hypothetical protein